MSRRRSSVITPPPEIADTQGRDPDHMSDYDKKEALIKLIRKGAPSVPSNDASHEDVSERARFSIRMNRNILERIGRAVADREIETPVNTWITEAILGQLKKEGF